MAPLRDASPIRVALVDDDSGPVTVSERVRGMRAGADDWVTKPCHPGELLARIQAVLRRRRAGELPLEETTIEAGELAIRPDRYDAYGDGRDAVEAPTAAASPRDDFAAIR